MLIGFFKNISDLDCQCQVVKYWDRVWLDQLGDATIFRCFVLEVLETSPSGLSEIRMLLPFDHPLHVREFSKSCFEPEYHLNNRGRGGRFSVEREPVKLREYGSPAFVGEVSDDGLTHVKVFIGASFMSSPFMDATLVTCKLPEAVDTGEKAVGPGEKVEVRASFGVSSLFENIAPSGRTPLYEVQAKYFDTTGHTTALDELHSEETEIPVLPTLGPPMGGFDVFFYFPRELEIGRCTPAGAAETVNDGTLPDGMSEDPYAVTRILWRAREVRPDADVLTSGKGHFALECANISPPSSVPKDLSEIRAKTEDLERRINDVRRDLGLSIRKGAKVSIVSVVVAVIALVVTVALALRG